MMNPYFPSNTEFSKSFGSSIYKPTGPAMTTSANKLASLKNSLVMNSYSGKGVSQDSTSYHNPKSMKKIEK